MNAEIRKLRQMRLETGKSQFQISRQTGIDRTRLSLAENGHVQLRDDELVKLERVLRNLASKRCQELINAAVA
ncbi:MAG TPA: helix-turn-helix transcriptional regulator [Terriglobales bacterium]|nr:helix-turn-helix transcriptional regulator [Terriglobales bacterium]